MVVAQVIEESLLDEWVANPKMVTPELLRMLISQLKVYQRNSSVIYVFPQQFFEGTPENSITPEKLRGFVVEKAVNGDYYFAAGVSRVMMRDGTVPVNNAPVVAVPPIKPARVIVNQDVINAFYNAFPDDGWSALVVAGLEFVANDRMGTFPPERVAGLPDEVKRVLVV